MSLEIKSLNKSFGEKIVITDFSYSFPDKGVFLVYGKSGVGKTTLLRIISGLDKSYSGEVVGGGAQNVSFAFQEYRLFPQLSALDNLLVAAYENPTEENRNEALSMLLSLGISGEEASLLPDALSGGMKQRVSLARAFLVKRPILLLDEPTKELNEELCEVIRKTIVSIGKERLVILVSHNEKEKEIEGIELIELIGAES